MIAAMCLQGLLAGNFDEPFTVNKDGTITKFVGPGVVSKLEPVKAKPLCELAVAQAKDLLACLAKYKQP